MTRPVAIGRERMTAGAAGAALLALVQIMLALGVMTRPALQTVPILLLLTAMAITSCVTIAQAALPVAAKATLIAGGCVTLFGVAAVVDVFGLRPTREAGGTDPATTIDTPVPATPPRPPATPGLTIEATGDPRAMALGSEMAATLAGSRDGSPDLPTVTAMVMVDDDAGGVRYRMSWSVRRNGEHLWCGQAQAQRSEQAAAAASFARLIRRARSVPAKEALRCE